MYYVLVKLAEEFVFQVFAVYEAPLAACVLVRPAVAFAREVDPFRMTELVAHKVEVAAVDCGERDEAYHFVERDAAVHVHVVVVNHHVPIHVGVDKTEDYRLVAHKCLVVAFGIVDCLFVGAAVGQLPEDSCRLPVLVFFSFMVFIQKSGMPIAMR